MNSEVKWGRDFDIEAIQQFCFKLRFISASVYF